MATYADVVAATLAQAGIEYIFGVPGSLSSVELIEAAAKRGIRYVLCSNESSAAVMAGVYGVLCNRPGVLSTGVGPGAMAGVLGVAHCYLERVPVLVLTDRYGEQEQLHLQRQRVDQVEVYKPITKASLTLSAQDAAPAITHAVELALAPRQGPVHIDLPYDLMQAEASPADFPAEQVVTPFVAHLRPDHPGLAAAAEAIEQAQKPAVIFGLQVSRSGVAAEDAFLRFAEHLGVPVLASLAAKGTLPEQHPLAAGTFRGVAVETTLLDQADLIVLVGFDPVEIFTPGVWRYHVPIVSIDEVASDEAPYQPDIEVVAPLAEALSLLTEAISTHTGWNREDIDAYRRALIAALPTQGSGLMPAAVIRIARERLPDDGILTVDAGQHKVLASDLWQARRRRGFLSSSGLGSMGVALPAALAAKLLNPTAPVLCFTGDGGFLMRTGDLETAVREQLPIVVVVFNDRTLNLIRIQQAAKGYQRLGTDFAESDFVAVALGFGWQASRVDSEASLDEALRQALASGRPWLIDTLINPQGYG